MRQIDRIAVGCDDAGIAMKEAIVRRLTEQGYTVTDLSARKGEDYPDVAERVAQSIVKDEHTRGILVCGTGIGMAITANKVVGIRAAQIPDTYSAERARKSNDAQIACFGSRTMGIEAVLVCLEQWFASDFSGSGSVSKVEKIKQVESRHLRQIE